MSTGSTEHVEQPLQAGDRGDDQVGYLCSSDNSDEFQQVRVNDQGSRPRRAQVLIQDVPVEGIVDTGADITIKGGDLFEKVASVARQEMRQNTLCLQQPEVPVRWSDGSRCHFQ